MHNYTKEELISLSDMFMRSQFSAQYYFGENQRFDRLEAEGKLPDGLAQHRLVFLGQLYLGFTSEVFSFFTMKKDHDLLSRLKSTKKQRQSLEAVRNTIFHVTNSKITNRRFNEFINTYKDWRSMFAEDFKIIGNYILEFHQRRSPAGALHFKDHWIRTSPFDLS